MHYSQHAFSANTLPTITPRHGGGEEAGDMGQRRHLTQGDRDKVAKSLHNLDYTPVLCQVWTVYGCGAREHVTRDPGAVHCSAAGTSFLHSILSIVVFVMCLLTHVREVNHD